MEITEFVRNIVCHLIDYPEELSITRVEGERGAVFEIRVNPADLGKVIGKSGRTVKALRTLVGALAARSGIRGATLEVVE